MNFKGSYVALATPFTAAGLIDEPAYRRLIGRQLRAGTAGLVPCGSTGEAATLTHAEYARLIEIAVEEARGKLPVIAGVASNVTAKAVELAQEVQALGADAILLLAPYYNKPTQEGLYRHFEAVARKTRLPIMVYNIPGRTAVNIQPATLARLAKDFSNIVAVKEASASLDQVSEILALVPKNFSVLSGDDSLTLPMLSVGAVGVVSVAANLAPQACARLCAAAAQGDFKTARALHKKMFPLLKALFLETNPIPLKAALALLGLCAGGLRLPLTPLSSRHRPRLKSELKAFGLL